MTTEKYHVKQIPKELRNQEVWSRRAYVDWINDLLKANFTNSIEFKNGAPYLQLIDMMFPGIVPMDEVKFSAEMQYDCFLNFRILEEAFRKLGINRIIDVDALSSGRHVESWDFLKWFKTFYDLNYESREYDAIKARNGAYMGFGRRDLLPKSSRTQALDSLEGRIKRRNGKERSASKSKATTSPVSLNKQSRSAECIQNNVGSESQSSPAMSMTSILKPARKLGGMENSFLKVGIKEPKECEEEVQHLLEDIRKFTAEKLAQDKPIERICEGKKEKSPLKPIEDKIDHHPPSTVKETAFVRKGYSHGDFNQNPDPNKDTAGDTKSTSTSNIGGSGINAIVVNKTQRYEEFGVRITENIQVRIESSIDGAIAETSSPLTEGEKHRKMNLMVEKFLNYQWSERKEYFQTLAEVLKEEKNNSP